MIDDSSALTIYGRAGAVFVVANSASGHARVAACARSAGLRLVGRSDLVAALDPLAAATLFVEVDAREPHDLDTLVALLRGVNEDVVANRFTAIVSTPTALIDLVAAAAPQAVQLADATDADRIAALAIASAPRRSGVREAAIENAELVRLARLTEEVARVAAALANATHALEAAPPARVHVPAPAEPVGADEVRTLIRARRLRAQFFDGELFADPAWDMLLDLAAAHADGDRVAVSSLCIAAAVPPTTALRWIRTLTDASLFVRTADPADGRRVFIELSEPAAASMQAYLSARRRLG